MKTKIALSGLAGLLLLALSVPAFAADNEKEVTIKGEGKCAKCAMHESDKCQTVIQKTEKGKTVNYYLAKNDVSKEFHDNVCKESKQVSAKGTVKEVDGKKVLTASSIELVK